MGKFIVSVFARALRLNRNPDALVTITRNRVSVDTPNPVGSALTPDVPVVAPIQTAGDTGEETIVMHQNHTTVETVNTSTIDCERVAEQLWNEVDATYRGITRTSRADRKVYATVCREVAETFRTHNASLRAYHRKKVRIAEFEFNLVRDNDPGCWNHPEDSAQFDCCVERHVTEMWNAGRKLASAIEASTMLRDENRQRSAMIQARTGGWWSALYSTAEEWGGPEEGGWTYETGRLEAKRWHATEEQAWRWAHVLLDRATAEDADRFYTYYQPRIRISETEPADFYPASRPRYS